MLLPKKLLLWSSLIGLLTVLFLLPPAEAAVPFYRVQAGDTLYKIAQQQNIKWQELQRINGLTDSWIYPGEVLWLNQAGTATEVLAERGFTVDDWQYLAQAIYGEARGESFTGQVAVGAVILNRLADPDFPDTIEQIVFQNNGRVYQFSSVADGNIYLSPNESAYEAALAAMQGYDPTGDALYFYNPQTASDRWIRTLPVMTQIGNHVFSNDY